MNTPQGAPEQQAVTPVATVPAGETAAGGQADKDNLYTRAQKAMVGAVHNAKELVTGKSQTQVDAEVKVQEELKGTPLEKGKLLTGSVEAGEGRHFDLGAELDEKLFHELVRVQRVINDLKNSNPNDPNITRLQAMLGRTLGPETVKDGQEKTPLRIRAEEILKIRDEQEKKSKSDKDEDKKKARFKDDYRIFAGEGAEERLAEALAVLEVDQLLTAEALGQSMTNGGTQPLDIALSSDLGQIEIKLKEATKSLPAKVGESVRKLLINAVDSSDHRKIRTALMAIAGVGGGELVGNVLGQFAGSAVGLEPAQAAMMGQNAGHQLGILFGMAGGTVANVDLIVEKTGDQIHLKFTTAKLDSRVITQYAELSGIGKSGTDIGKQVLGVEELRHRIYQRMGLDLHETDHLSMINLDPNDIDPGANTVSRGTGLIRFNNQRQEALAEILKSLHKQSLFELTPEQRLEAILKSYDNAAGNFCKDEARAVLEELNKKGQPVRDTDADALEAYAQDLETGKKSLKTIEESEVKTKKDEKAKAEELQKLRATKKARLDEIDGQLPSKRTVRDTAIGERNITTARYETPAAGHTLSPIDEARSISLKLEGDIGILSGKITASITALATRKRNITQLNSEISALEAEKAKIKPVNQKDPNQIQKAKEDQDDFQRDKIEPKINDLENERTELDIEETQNAQLKAEKAGLEAQKNKIDGDINRVETKIEGDERALQKAETEVKNLETERDEILKYFGWDGTSPDRPKTEDVLHLVSAAEADVAKLTQEVTELEEKLRKFKAGEGEATDTDKDTAKALRMVAQLSRVEDKSVTVGDKTTVYKGRFNEVIMGIADGSVSIEELCKTGGYEAWCQMLFGPTANPEDQERARRILSKAIMVETAIDVYHLDADVQFGIDAATGRSRFAPVRDNRTKIAQNRDKINELQTRQKAADITGGDTWEQQIDKLKKEIDGLQDANYQLLSGFYAEVSPLFARNRWETADYTRELIDRIRKKSLTDPFAKTSDVELESTLVRNIGTTVITPSGRVTVEPAVVSGGVEQYHENIRVSTPAHYKIPSGAEVPITIETQIMKPESVAGATDRIALNLTVRLDAALYNALPKTKAGLGTDWPPIFDDVYDSAGNIKPIAEAGIGRFLTANQTVGDMIEAISTLSQWNELGELDEVFPQAVGQMFGEVTKDERKKYFGSFKNALPLTFGSAANTEKWIISQNADGDVNVSMTLTSGGVPTTISLTELLQNYEVHYRRIYNISPTDPVSADDLNDTRNYLLTNLGWGVLHSTLNY
jgi:hypothetical protein